jgi:hypothetical protein
MENFDEEPDRDHSCCPDRDAATAPVVNADDTNVPGYTGQTIVRGSNSTIVGDAIATRMQQTDSYSR